MGLILGKSMNTGKPLLKLCMLSFDTFKMGYLMSQQKKSLFWFGAWTVSEVWTGDITDMTVGAGKISTLWQVFLTPHRFGLLSVTIKIKVLLKWSYNYKWISCAFLLWLYL